MVYGTAYIGIHNPTPQVHRKSWRSHIPNGFAGADGRQLHVVRVVNPREAAMARQNFEMYARGARHHSHCEAPQCRSRACPSSNSPRLSADTRA